MIPGWITALALMALSSLCLASCEAGKHNKDDNNDGNVVDKIVESVSKQQEDKESFLYEPVKYSRLAVTGKTMLDSLKKLFNDRQSDPARYRAIRTLNRKYIDYIRLNDTIVVPEKFYEDTRAYSVFPNHYKAADTIPKLIVVSNAFQAYAAYEKGWLVRFVAVNTGRQDQPLRAGLYHLMWKDRNHRSTIDHDWIMPYTFNISNRGNAFHQFSMPGYPASHGCARQFIEDAQWLFQWGDQWKVDSTGSPIPKTGTPVVILDNYDFSRGKKGAWLYLQSNRDTLLPLPEDPLNFSADNLATLKK